MSSVMDKQYHITELPEFIAQVIITAMYDRWRRGTSLARPPDDIIYNWIMDIHYSLSYYIIILKGDGYYNEEIASLLFPYIFGDQKNE